MVLTQQRKARNVKVEGPPGTGKSYTMYKAIEYFLKQGHCVISLAPLARVIQQLRPLVKTYPKSFRCETWHRWTCESGDSSSVDPNAKFKRAVTAGKPLVSPMGRTGLCFLFLHEYVGMTQVMVDKAINCCKACSSFTYAGCRAEGDLGQLLPPVEGHVPAVASLALSPVQCITVTLEQNERFKDCKELCELVCNLRDVTQNVSRKSLDTIELLSQPSKRREITLAALHKTVDAVRRRIWRQFPDEQRIEIVPVKITGRKGNRGVAPAACVLVLGEPVIVTENTWIEVPQKRPTKTNTRQFVANGTMGILQNWSWRHTGIVSLDANDKLLEWVEVKLEDRDMPLRFQAAVLRSSNGFLCMPLAYGRAATIHSMQGRTFTKSGTVDITGVEASIACRSLGVGIGRFKRLRDVSVILDDVQALSKRYPVHEIHDREQVRMHKEEAALRTKRASAT